MYCWIGPEDVYRFVLIVIAIVAVWIPNVALGFEEKEQEVEGGEEERDEEGGCSIPYKIALILMNIFNSMSCRTASIALLGTTAT
jgi:hypothetical protein